MVRVHAPALVILLAAVVALVLPLAALTAEAKAPPCVVTPNPVSLNTATPEVPPTPSTSGFFNLTATGGVPDTLYEIRVMQSGHRLQDEASTFTRVFSDASGSINDEVPYLDGREVGAGSPGPLWPGSASVKVQRARAGGGDSGKGSILLTTCSFDVVE